ncbi:MAG: methyltransferase domain-containing protein [Candidatus Liptonbacteria bacterium]|nr:methyltransferase domain-containing protein [Candidatus Liptonbacteria bacterium]
MDGAKRILQKLGLYRFAVACYMRARYLRHRLTRSGYFRKTAITRACRAGPVRLHLGCGERLLPGWLNADIYHGDIYLDITKSLPFPAASVDRAYSHHLIEHVELQQFVAFLSELARVMKPGGSLHFVTPDLDRLIAAYQNPLANQDLIAHYCQSTAFAHPVEMFNQELRQNGEHRYIYNLDFLKFLFERAGFTNVRMVEYDHSPIPDLAGLDDHGYRIIDRISLAVEAEKA